jgi:hypothetical protein
MARCKWMGCRDMITREDATSLTGVWSGSEGFTWVLEGSYRDDRARCPGSPTGDHEPVRLVTVEAHPGQSATEWAWCDRCSVYAAEYLVGGNTAGSTGACAACLASVMDTALQESQP